MPLVFQSAVWISKTKHTRTSQEERASS